MMLRCYTKSRLVGTQGLQMVSLPKSMREIPLVVKSLLILSLKAKSLFFLARVLSSINLDISSSVISARFNAFSFNCSRT